MRRGVERKLLLGMRLKRECMRLLGRLVSKSEVKGRWVNSGMGLVGVSFKLLVRMSSRGWSRIGEGKDVWGCTLSICRTCIPIPSQSPVFVQTSLSVLRCKERTTAMTGLC